MKSYMTTIHSISWRIFILALLIIVFIPYHVIHFSSHGPIDQGSVVQANNSNSSYEDGVVVVELMPNRNPSGVAARYNLVVQEQIDGDFWLLGIPDGRTVCEVIDQIENDKDVKSVEPNYLLTLPEVNQRSVFHVDGPGAAGTFFQQAALQVIRALDAQALHDGSGVVVAVIDTGVDDSHPALGDVLAGYDYVDDDSDPAEVAGGSGYGHGTMVAGLIALAAPGVSIMPVRAFGPDGRGSASDVAKAIRYAAMNGAGVINLSFGTVDQPQAMRGAINFARSRAVLVASAGNQATEVPMEYPASDVNVVAVAATDLQDYKASFSSYGAHIRVCAPGVSVTSAYPGGNYATSEGTSFAAALVSGTVALVLAAGQRDAVSAIENSAVNIDALNPGYQGLLGAGRIDAYEAVLGGWYE